MTVALAGIEIAGVLDKEIPGSVVDSDNINIVIKSESLLKVAAFLKDRPNYNFNFLSSITAVDYSTYFELVYHLVSMKHNHSLVLKVKIDHHKPVAPSLTNLWRGADWQEREAYDLMGIYFEGHPNLKRILLWEGFKGNPLRKDYK